MLDLLRSRDTPFSQNCLFINCLFIIPEKSRFHSQFTLVDHKPFVRANEDNKMEILYKWNGDFGSYYRKKEQG